ncbi:RHS repeat-associated core domain-containing protein [Enterobacterales bacterium AW_CKDN230030176-1A_HGKHYDSX7]
MNKVTFRSQGQRAYEPYGYCKALGSTAGLLGFSGVHVDAGTGNYALGNGHRMYNPRLMRFQSPDWLSPFDRGGANAYVYCLGDPVNRADPSGQFSLRRTWQAWRGGPKPVTSLSELKNTNADRLWEEIKSTRNNLSSRSASLKVVTDKAPLAERLSASSSHTHKWLVTERGELVIGTFDHTQVYSTHASFAALATERHGTSPVIVAAGEFHVKERKIVMTNYSGHYKTPYNRLWPVKMHLEQLDRQVRIVRQSYLADPPAAKGGIWDDLSNANWTHRKGPASG